MNGQRPLAIHSRAALAAGALVAGLACAGLAFLEVALAGIGSVVAIAVGALAMALPPPAHDGKDDA